MKDKIVEEDKTTDFKGVRREKNFDDPKDTDKKSALSGDKLLDDAFVKAFKKKHNK